MNNSSKKEGASSKKSFKKDDRPFKKFEKDTKPFKKSFGDKKEEGFKKPFNKEDKPFKKPYGDKGAGFKKDFNKEDKPFKKSFGDRKDEGFKKPFNKEDKPFRRSYGDKSEGGFKKPYNGAEKPYKKPYEDKEDSGFKKPYNKEEKSFKRPYEDRGEGGFRKPYNKEDKPFKKSYEAREEGGFKKPYNKEDKPFKKSYGDKKEEGFKKPFNREERPYKKSNEGKGEGGYVKSDKNAEQFAPRKKRSFGKFDEDDLSFGKKNKTPLPKPEKQEDEITFSKSIEKWEEEPVTPPYGRVEEKLSKKRSNVDKPSRFKRKFDSENPHEKAYSNESEGKPKDKVDYFSEAALEGEMPLNKFIAHCGVCSRRDAVILIKEGKVKVNDELIVAPGHKVTLEDKITLSGKKLKVQTNLVYILLNKPKGFITTNDDPKGRRTVLDLFENQIEERIFPVGRLDRNTTGVLLLTNDGDLTQKLSHPKYAIRKVYQVTLNKDLSLEDFDKIKEGVILEDGPAPVDQVEFLDAKNELGLEIHSGKNRIVRRIFESLGYEVEKLDRVIYAGLTKKNVLRGKWRFLSKQEVINLKHLN